MFLSRNQCLAEEQGTTGTSLSSVLKAVCIKLVSGDAITKQPLSPPTDPSSPLRTSLISPPLPQGPFPFYMRPY